MTVSIFIYDRGLQVHHYNLVKGFADRGDTVFIFTYNVTEDFFPSSNFKFKNVYLYNLYNPQSFNNRIQRKIIKLFKIFKNVFHLKIYNDYTNFISIKAIVKTIKIVKGIDEITLVIGCEKKGLIWAGKVFEGSKTKLIYYSLELYEDGHYSFLHDRSFPIVRIQEIFYHQKCAATIIQDQDRCNFLYKINKIESQPTFYLPVSVSENISYLELNYLQKKINVFNKKIILYFGKIDDERKVSDIGICFSKIITNRFVLVLNGFGQVSYIAKLREISDKIFHLNPSPYKYIDSIIHDAYIGLVLYDYKSKNEELTVYASEKLAYYLKHKKPIIAFHNIQYEKFFSNYKCGVAIKNVNELKGAIQTIEKNYNFYQVEAHRAFKEIYCFENRFNSVYEEIKLKFLK